MKNRYVVRELVAFTRIEGAYGNMWIVWRGSRVLSWEEGWMDSPDVSDVKTFRSERMARRSAYEWKGITMHLDDAVENGWVIE
jgi:hypothetical protein